MKLCVSCISGHLVSFDSKPVKSDLKFLLLTIKPHFFSRVYTTELHNCNLIWVSDTLFNDFRTNPLLIYMSDSQQWPPLKLLGFLKCMFPKSYGMH